MKKVNHTTNSFYAAGLFLYPRKTSENYRFSDVFGGYRKRSGVWNELNPAEEIWKSGMLFQLIPVSIERMLSYIHSNTNMFWVSFVPMVKLKVTGSKQALPWV